MAQYRAQTDPLVPQVAPNVHWYCAAGTDGGATGSALRFANQYLAQFGPNDSLVTVANACVPYAKLLFVGPYHSLT